MMDYGYGMMGYGWGWLMMIGVVILSILGIQLEIITVPITML